MSANWKNPFLKDKNQTHDENTKARVSCEAIPEEMTPPDPPAPLTCQREVAADNLAAGLTVDVRVKHVAGPATTGELGKFLWFW